MGIPKIQTRARKDTQSSHHSVVADEQRTMNWSRTATVDSTKHVLVTAINWTCRLSKPSPGTRLISSQTPAVLYFAVDDSRSNRNLCKLKEEKAREKEIDLYEILLRPSTQLEIYHWMSVVGALVSHDTGEPG